MSNVLKRCGSGLFCLAFGLAVVGLSAQINAFSNYDPLGPSRYPMVLGILIAVLGAVLCLPKYQDQPEENGKKLTFKENLLPLLGIWGCCAFYLICFEKIGFIPTNFLTLMGSTAILGERNLKKMALFSAIVSLVLYLLFRKMLGILLPPMPFLNI